MTFTALEKASRGASYEVIDIITSAAENANDTVYVEQEASESEWNLVAYGSVKSILCDRTVEPATAAWFKAHGVNW